MVLGETGKMAATSADRRKVAPLGVGRADWLCIGTSLDALGARGRVTAPGPDSQNLVLASGAGVSWSWLPRLVSCRRWRRKGTAGRPCVGRAAGRPLVGRLSRVPQLVSMRSRGFGW